MADTNCLTATFTPLNPVATLAESAQNGELNSLNSNAVLVCPVLSDLALLTLTEAQLLVLTEPQLLSLVEL